MAFQLELDYSFRGMTKSYVANDCAQYVSKAGFSTEECELWLRGCAERGIPARELEESFKVLSPQLQGVNAVGLWSC
eukprot:scaffold5087_cov430-Prasinococcus_capsulatus_cf.AAC.7